MQLFSALAFISLAVSVYLVGEVVTQPSQERKRAVRRAATYGRHRVAVAGLDRLRFHERVLLPATASLARLTLRVNPRTSLDAISMRLLAAGMSRSLTPTTFLAIKAGAGIGGGVLGFVAGTAKLTEHRGGALGGEFSLPLGEMRIGESRHDALKKLAARSGAPEVASFCRAIIQADQLGISLGRLLRVQATDARLKRQAAAEEKAMKSPIKMLFPTVIFIFPAMFIVILGPAMLNLMKI